MWPSRRNLQHPSFPTVSDALAAEETHLRLVNEDASQAALWLWESPSYAVVVGRSNVIETEVDVAACQSDGVPILRRISGGGAVVVGPGCLCYALMLPIDEVHRRLGVSAVTADIMQRLATALSTSEQTVEVRGVSDLVVNGRKFSGNSQRWLRNALLHHGTVLYDFDLPLVSRYLRTPSRQPDYRSERPHAEFITSLTLPCEEVASRLTTSWNAQ